MSWFEQVWEEIKTYFLSNWNNILIFALVLIFGFLLIKIIIAIFSKGFKKSKLNNAAGDFLVSVIKALLYVIYLIALLSILGIPTTSLIALFSAFSLAISLSLQETMSNIASGIHIIINKPFIEGDFVEIDNKCGTIEHISIFNTKMTTPDNKEIIIPNNTVAKSNITNFSSQPERRLDIDISVAYGTDVETLKSVVFSVIAKNEKVLNTPKPFIALNKSSENSLDFVCRVWVKNADYWDVNFSLREKILESLNENNITIPFNQLDVHIKN